MSPSHGTRLRQHVAASPITPFIGIYDVFSATIAARHFPALFVSGFGFSASHYGLPDLGYIAWSDLVQFVQRVRTVLPEHHLLVDIDDGYGDPDVAAHVVALLEAVGASGVVLEDQRRPRRCGHFSGKQLLDLDVFVKKLHKVLGARQDLLVIARTDATEADEIGRRVHAYAEVGADAVLVDGVEDLNVIRRLAGQIQVPFTFNQIAGGKSPAADLTQLEALGVSLVIYSTPCLFAAQDAMHAALVNLKLQNGLVNQQGDALVDVGQCTQLLRENQSRRFFLNSEPSPV